MEKVTVSQLKQILKELINESIYDVPEVEKPDSDRPYGGWLDPDCKFHPVGFQQHSVYSSRVLRQMGVARNMHYDSNEELYTLKFIRIIFSFDTLHFQHHAVDQKLPEPTPRQMKALKDVAIEHGCHSLWDDNTNRQVSDTLEESTNFVGLKYWWMDSHYKLHSVSFEQHRQWAEDYLKRVGYGPVRDVYKAMYKLGWVRLVKQNYNGQKLLSYQYTKERPLNSKQLKNIKDLAIEEQCDYMIDDVTNRETSLKENITFNEDMSYEELLKLTTPERKERASNVNARSLPVSVENNNEQWNFRYKSSPQTTVTDKPFKGSISFLKGKVGQNNNAMKMKCKVDCECPDFMYRFAYNDTAKGASQIGPDSLNKAINRKPKPAYDEGLGLCKHLTALGKFLKTKIQATKKSNLFEAIDNVANQGPFNVTYFD